MLKVRRVGRFKLKSRDSLKSAECEMKTQRRDERPCPSVHLSNFAFGNEMSSSLWASTQLVNCFSHVPLRKRMTK